MKSFNDLKKINVNDHLEKKGNLSYLSWAWAVDKLLENDPMATWEFSDPKHYGQTVMVFCSVTAFGKTMKMHLPVMDNRNNAMANPDARKISDAMMRCLAKCIACFGIGLYIYAGEDVPYGDDDDSNKASMRQNPYVMKNHQPSKEEIEESEKYSDGVYRCKFGTIKNRSLEEVLRVFGPEKIIEAIDKTEERLELKKPYTGVTLSEMEDFVDIASDFLGKIENEADKITYGDQIKDATDAL